MSLQTYEAEKAGRLIKARPLHLFIKKVSRNNLHFFLAVYRFFVDGMGQIGK